MYNEEEGTVTITEEDVDLRPFDPKEAFDELEAGQFTMLLGVTSDNKVVAYYAPSRPPEKVEGLESSFMLSFTICCCHTNNKKGSMIGGVCCCGNKAC
jgi:hypothetical protein